VEKLTARRPGPPNDHLSRSRPFRFVHLAQERGKDVRTVQIEVVARAVEVRWHGGDEALPELPRVGLAELDPSNLGESVGFVRRLERAGQQRRLGNRLRRELWVNARRPKEQELSRTEVSRSLDHVVLNPEILQEELYREIVVRLDPSDLRGSNDRNDRQLRCEKCAHGFTLTKVDFTPVADQKARIARLLEFAEDCSPSQTAVTGYENGFFDMHSADASSRVNRCIALFTLCRKPAESLNHCVPSQRSRLPVLKTYKLYIGGKFPRGESGRVGPARSLDGRTHLANYCQASRKDFRDAAVAARKAQPGWEKASAHLRGQILYRAAEMSELRRAELEAELSRAGVKQAGKEVSAAIDRLVHYAGWTDKFPQLFGSVNPVASQHFDFTFPEPTGVVVVVCPDSPSLLGMVSLIAPVILAGNTSVVLAGETLPLVALTFAEILATSDLPGGVINILTGARSELASHFASHMDVNAIVDGSGDPSAINLKRYCNHSLSSEKWFANDSANPYWIVDTVEMKTAWHPIGT
jgi:Aldehyde dehydrogenase family